MAQALSAPDLMTSPSRASLVGQRRKGLPCRARFFRNCSQGDSLKAPAARWRESNLEDARVDARVAFAAADSTVVSADH